MSLELAPRPSPSQERFCPPRRVPCQNEKPSKALRGSVHRSLLGAQEMFSTVWLWAPCLWFGCRAMRLELPGDVT